MKSIFNFEKPLQSAIILYIIIFLIIYVFRPDYVIDKENRNKIFVMIIILSVICYGIFMMIKNVIS